MQLSDWITEKDAGYEQDARPVINLISMAHGGSRSTAAYLESQGYRVRVFHIQLHTHDIDVVRELFTYADPIACAVRDPLLCLLSTQARQDDKLSRVFDRIKDFATLPLDRDVHQIYPVELIPGFPNIGAIDYPEKAMYASRDIEQIKSLHPEIAAMLPELEAATRVKLELIGYAGLPWWSA